MTYNFYDRRHGLCPSGLRRDERTQRPNSGFTLIELLVVMLMVGMLSSIALPTLFSQVNKAKETEAQLSLNALKKNQYIFYLVNGNFTSDLGALTFPHAETKHYQYGIEDLSNYSALNGRLHLALSKQKAMRSYASVVYFEGDQLTECSLFAMDVSLEDSAIEILRFIFEAVANYRQYCP